MNQEVQNTTAIQLLYDEADNILQMLKRQETLCLSCPVVEEIIDTKMYGFSEKINFAIDLNIVDKAQGNQLLSKLERDISIFYNTLEDNK